MFKNPEYNNSPIQYSFCHDPEIKYHTPTTHIKGNKTLTPAGRALIPTLKPQEQHIFNFILQKANNHNLIIFSQDLFKKYRGYISQFILKAVPKAKNQCYMSYSMFKSTIISLLNKRIILKPKGKGPLMMLNPAYAYSSYHGVAHISANFSKEYGELTNKGLMTPDKLCAMCDYYVEQAKIRTNWLRKEADKQV